MKRITFAIYVNAPIACEGNDDPKQIRVVNIHTDTSECIIFRAQKVAEWLARRSSCYVQVWDIA